MIPRKALSTKTFSLKSASIKRFTVCKIKILQFANWYLYQDLAMGMGIYLQNQIK